MRVLPTVLCILTALAGCLDGGAPDETAEATPAPSVIDPLAWSGTDCDGRGDFIAVDKAWADAQAVPYESDQIDVVRGALALFTADCADVAVANESTGPDRITVVAIMLGFDTPEGPFGPALVRTALLWAYHATGETPLAKLVAAAGVPVIPAEVDIESWDGAMTITADGQSVEVMPTVPNQGTKHHVEDDTWLFLREGPDGLLAWTWHIPTGSDTTETYLHATTLLGGAPFAGACSPLEAVPGACHRSNTDDILGFDIVGSTATPEEAGSG